RDEVRVLAHLRQRGEAMALLVIAASIVLLLQSPKASIEGVVVRIGSGEPIAGVQVRLTRVPGPQDAIPAAGADEATDPTPPNAMPLATSDRQRKFVLKDLDTGSYRITAART